MLDVIAKESIMKKIKELKKEYRDTQERYSKLIDEKIKEQERLCKFLKEIEDELTKKWLIK